MQTVMFIFNKLVIIICVLCNTAYSQYKQWGNLKPGPYSVGYKTIRTIDYSRKYFENGRPLQIYVWYPAVKNAGVKHMTYGDYFDDASYDWGSDIHDVKYLKNYFINGYKSASLNPSFPQPVADKQFQKIIQTSIPSVRNAIPAKGKFPILLHAHANGVLYQSILMEYLASQGYVLMSISTYNTSPAFYGRGEEGINALMALTDDLALVLSQAQKLAFADINNVAMIGMMAQAGVGLQTRGMPLKSIACLDCSWIWGDVDAIKQLPYFDTKKINIPILELANIEMGEPQKFADSLSFADRYIGTFNKFSHGDFYPYPKITSLQEGPLLTNHDNMIMTTLHFLNTFFKPVQGKFNSESLIEKAKIPADFLTIRNIPGQKLIPPEGEFLTWLRYGKIDKVKEKLPVVKNIVSQNNFFFTTLFLAVDNEPHALEALTIYLAAFPSDTRVSMIFPRLGYNLLNSKQSKKAIEVFELFVKQFPQSPYAYSGLADAYAATGQKEKAKESAEKVIELIDKSNLQIQEKESLKKKAQQKIY